MRLLSPFLTRVAYPVMAKAHYFSRWHCRKSCGPLMVVTYHGVFPEGYEVQDPLLDGNLVTRSAFRDQLSLLKSRYHVISPQEFLDFLDKKTTIPSNSVLLTCDDGLLNVVTDMLPVLKELELSCLFFLTGASTQAVPQMLWYEELWMLFQLARGKTLAFQNQAITVGAIPAGRVERHASWWKLVGELSQYDAAARADFLARFAVAAGLPVDWKADYLEHPIRRRRFQLLTRDQVRELVSAGMSVGAHTLTHPVLSRCPSEGARQEIEMSGCDPVNLWGSPTWAFAYPFGTPECVSPRELMMAESAGYRCAFVNVGGGVSEVRNWFAIPRVHILADMRLGDFEAHVSGFHWYLKSRLGRIAGRGIEEPFTRAAVA